MERFAFRFTRLRVCMFWLVNFTFVAGSAGTLHSFGRRWQKSSQPYGTLVVPPTAAVLAAVCVEVRLKKLDCAAAGLTCSEVAPINETRPMRNEDVRT